MRTVCVHGHRPYINFETRLNLSVGKLDASDLAEAGDLLSIHLLQAIFKRDVPPIGLFDGMGPMPATTLLIRFDGFGNEMTLASFVHWTSLFFDGLLRLENFHDLFTDQNHLRRSGETPTGVSPIQPTLQRGQMPDTWRCCYVVCRSWQLKSQCPDVILDTAGISLNAYSNGS